MILPQAMRLMIRPLGVNINSLIRATALVAPISVVELTYTAQRYIGSTYRPFEMFLLAGIPLSDHHPVGWPSGQLAGPQGAHRVTGGRHGT